MALKLPQRQDREVAEFRLPPTGFYLFEFTDYGEPEQSRFQDKATGEYPMRVPLTLTVRKDISGDDEFDGVECTKWCGLEMNANAESSIYHVLKALLGGDEPDRPDLDDYVHLRCIGELTHSKPKPSRDDPTRSIVFPNVGKVSPRPKARPRKPPTPEPEADDDDLGPFAESA
jgi:hypothetical protein